MTVPTVAFVIMLLGYALPLLGAVVWLRHGAWFGTAVCRFCGGATNTTPKK